ncbi:MAG: hypothetical protein QOF71_2329 [Candidatus Eremiobacteraeota bacterium]|jgi:hypothetical protein|nr:hypothetical protein [Candidatus Eremiobacteraeota bacterium]
MKRIAVTQSNYLPWKGYFDTIASVDEVVLLDRVQYTRRDWRNRNLIKTRAGLRWITVPVRSKGCYRQAIDETIVDGHAWIAQHLAAVRHAYARAAAFSEEFPWLEALLRSAPGNTISSLNRALIEGVCARLGIVTKIRDAREFNLPDDRNERLLAICAQAGAAEYVSGPTAKAYLDADLFARRGVRIRWKSYARYPPYKQPHPPFEHRVSIVDTLMCTGSAACRVIRSAAAFE